MKNIGDWNKDKNTVIFDLDGTLAKVDKRVKKAKIRTEKSKRKGGQQTSRTHEVTKMGASQHTVTALTYDEHANKRGKTESEHPHT